MVGESPGADDSDAESAQVGFEPLGARDPGEGERRKAFQRCQSDRFPLRRHEPARLQSAVEQRRARLETLERGRQVGRDLPRRPGQDEGVGARQGRDRLAQRAAGQHSTIAPGVAAVQQQEVEVARQPAMLERVVEHEDLGRAGARQETRRGDAIRADRHRHRRIVAGDEVGLVPRALQQLRHLGLGRLQGKERPPVSAPAP